MRITIINEQNFIPVNEAKVREAVHALPSCEEKKKFRLSLVYLNDEEIAKFNERYLKHEGPTDVLAFPMDLQNGEILVSGETALREARLRGIEPEGELLLYTVHGVLHLLGYDDKTPEEASEMHAIEKKIITQLGYSWSWDE
jgi:probable rRNA maturation factor